MFFKYISMKLEIKKENNFQHQVVEVLEIVLGCVENNLEWLNKTIQTPDYHFVLFSSPLIHL